MFYWVFKTLRLEYVQVIRPPSKPMLASAPSSKLFSEP